MLHCVLYNKHFIFVFVIKSVVTDICLHITNIPECFSLRPGVCI